MKIKPLYNNNNIVSIEQILSDKGIDDIDEYLKPTNKYMENPQEQVNMDKAIGLFYHNLLNRNKTYILSDSGDCDGITSTSILYSYMKELEPKWTIKVGIHKGKERGLQDDILLKYILANDIKFVIIPDAGTNDKKQAEILKDNNIDLLVLDHHQLSTPIEYGVLVNNQQGNVDHFGSGCAETFLFMKAFDNYIGGNFANKYIDMVGLSIISDCMNVCSQQNRKYLYYGLLNYKRVNNPLLKELINQNGLIDKGDYSQKDIAFNVVPCINSVCRSDNMELKQEMLMGFMGLLDERKVNELLKKMKSQHSKQQKLVNDFVDDHIEYIENKNDKSVFIYASDDVPRAYSGLIASKIKDRVNNKPTIILAKHGDNFIGSVRSDSPIREQLANNPYVDFAQGHSGIFGIGIKEKDYDNFVDSLDSLIIPLESDISVLQSYPISSIPKRLFGYYEPYRALWGQGLEEPTFHIYNIKCTKDMVDIIGSNQNVLRIRYKGITLIKFFCNSLDKERFMCYNKFSLEVIGTLNLNEWNGKAYPQVIFDKYEISKREKQILEDLI